MGSRLAKLQGVYIVAVLFDRLHVISIFVVYFLEAVFFAMWIVCLRDDGAFVSRLSKTCRRGSI